MGEGARANNVISPKKIYAQGIENNVIHILKTPVYIKQFQAQSSLSSPSCTHPHSCVINNGFLPKCIEYYITVAQKVTRD